TLTGIMANTLVTPATPDIVDDFGVGRAGVGLLLAAATAPGIVLAPVIGLLSDRYGRRAVVVPCLVVFGLAGGMAAFSPTFEVLLALRLLQGFGSAGLINLAVVIIGDHWDGVERARMIGRNAAALTASIAVLPPLGGLLAAIGGWRWTFAPYWIGLVTAVAVLRYLGPSERGTGTVGEQLRATKPYLRMPVVLGSMGMAFVLFVLIFGGFLTVLPVHLKDEFDVSAGLRGLVLGVPAIPSTIMALNLGRLRRRFGAGPVLVFGSLATGGGFAILAVAPSLPLLMLGPVLYGFGEGLMIPTLQDAVTSAAPASSRGAIVATFVGVSRLGQTVGPIAAGAGLVAFGSEPVFLAGAAVASAMALAYPTVRARSR
ncbi:MAG TPA: MFS transporter, partial [Acidimicrobiales bacterium]|nr:MFS transporter [Acidimicrobiales bacterium]